MLRVGNATGISEDENILSNTQVYPNPASKDFFVSFNLKSASTFSMEIYDLSGRMVKGTSESLLPAGTHLIDQNIESLSNGYYMLRFILDNSASETLPLIVR